MPLSPKVLFANLNISEYMKFDIYTIGIQLLIFQIKNIKLHMVTDIKVSKENGTCLHFPHHLGWQGHVAEYLKDRVIPGKHHVGGSANTNPLWSTNISVHVIFVYFKWLCKILVISVWEIFHRLSLIEWSIILNNPLSDIQFFAFCLAQYSQFEHSCGLLDEIQSVDLTLCGKGKGRDIGYPGRYHRQKGGGLFFEKN